MVILDIKLRPDVFAAVMATGIISIAANDHHYRLISDTLGVLATAALIGLVLLVVLELIARRTFAFAHLDDPDSALRMFTFVAAAAVLAARVDARSPLFWVLAAAAVAAWLVVSPIALRGIATRDLTQLRGSARGAWLLASVATCGVAIVLADAGAPLPACLAVWALAVIVYALITSLIVWGAVADGSMMDRAAPDSWILMGGLAIAALTGNHIYRAFRIGGVEIATITMWALASAWIPVLVYLSLRRINAQAGSLRFGGVWWAMVFPLGMYSAATEATSIDARLPALATISLVFLWIALAAWLIVALAGLRTAARISHC